MGEDSTLSHILQFPADKYGTTIPYSPLDCIEWPIGLITPRRVHDCRKSRFREMWKQPDARNSGPEDPKPNSAPAPPLISVPGKRYCTMSLNTWSLGACSAGMSASTRTTLTSVAIYLPTDAAFVSLPLSRKAIGSHAFKSPLPRIV